MESHTFACPSPAPPGGAPHPRPPVLLGPHEAEGRPGAPRPAPQRPPPSRRAEQVAGTRFRGAAKLPGEGRSSHTRRQVSSPGPGSNSGWALGLRRPICVPLKRPARTPRAQVAPGLAQARDPGWAASPAARAPQLTPGGPGGARRPLVRVPRGRGPALLPSRQPREPRASPGRRHGGDEPARPRASLPPPASLRRRGAPSAFPLGRGADSHARAQTPKGARGLGPRPVSAVRSPPTAAALKTCPDPLSDPDLDPGPRPSSRPQEPAGPLLQLSRLSRGLAFSSLPYQLLGSPHRRLLCPWLGALHSLSPLLPCSGTACNPPPPPSRRGRPAVRG